MDLSELQKRLSGRRIFHAYIVTGADGQDRMRAARLIANAAVCSGTGSAPCGVCRDCIKAAKGVHPDIDVLSREEKAKEHTVDSVRDLRARAGILPNEAEKAVHIIDDADLMNLQAQNAILKTLEEPPEHAVFVLLAENPLKLLPTVRSRCETVTLPPKIGGTDCPEAVGAIIKAYASGDDLALVRALAPVKKLDRAGLAELISALRTKAVTALGPAELLKLSDTLDEAEKMSGANVNAGHITGLMLGSLCHTK